MTIHPALWLLLAACSMASGLPPAPHDMNLATDMAEGARRFLTSLSQDQARRGRFAIDDAERLDWHYIPRRRPGVALGELTHAQRHLAYGFLATALDRRGLLKASAIMALEEVLHQREQGRGTFTRDAAAYFLTIFGEPSTGATWGWRLEGHHVSINMTLVDGVYPRAAPVFLGAAPSVVTTGLLAGTRVLGREEELGFRLVGSLDPGQRREAIIRATAPDDILAAPGVALVELPGLVATRMTAAQRTLLGALLAEIVENLPREQADRERARLVGRGLDPLVFSWAGGIEPGKPHYFRITGPSFLYEYDNTQQGATHVHTVWHARAAVGGDFGIDLLRDHYRNHSHGAQR
ncbi:MAG: DUF3500 domain-containing protein [Kofleriaceae bacterium]